MSKQDGYASRTAADLERKYNFGKTFAEVYGLVSDAQQTADEAKEAIEGLDQEAIFNLLTNFGQAQGVYRGADGNVYMNASYIKSGKLAADYIDAENLKVAAANITGELVATQIDTKDLKVLAANITGQLTAGQIDATNLSVSAANVTGKLTASQIDATNLKVSAANVTGTLTANQIDATNLKVSAANITGSLTIGQLPGTVAQTSDIPTYTSQLTNNSGYQTTSGVVSIIEGTVTADYISAFSIAASLIQGGTVYLKPSSYYTAGYLSISGASTSSYAVELRSYGALKLNANNGAAYMSSGYGSFLQLSSGDIALGGGDVRPGSPGTYDCGTSSYYWSDIYALNSTIQTSDRNAKKEIIYGVDDYDGLFDSLKPVSFLFKDGSSGRRHIGLIAQDVEQALIDNGISTLDFAGFIKSPKTDEDGNVVEDEYTYALRYCELIPMCIDQIQKLNKRVKELEALNT